MGILDRLFGKKGEATEEELLSSHETRYDHHAPINFDDWEPDEEPLLDIEQLQRSAAAETNGGGQRTHGAAPRHAPVQRQCQTAEEASLTIVLTVMARDGDHFEGGDLLREFNAAGLHIGKDRLFHRYPEQGEPAPLFSLSNVLNPGVFDPTRMLDLQTRGLALFLQLPSVHPGKTCFAALVEAANTLATGLGGQVMDGGRRPLSNHMLQRMQEQVLEFEYCRELERRKAEQQGRK